ncbi:hypothetical protein LLE95_12705, partial [Pediococcus acidilactici]|nr:hypothetical protein [Pediococcus acidilactici]
FFMQYMGLSPAQTHLNTNYFLRRLKNGGVSNDSSSELVLLLSLNALNSFFSTFLNSSSLGDDGRTVEELFDCRSCQSPNGSFAACVFWLLEPI